MWGLAGAGVAALWALPRAPYWATVSLYVAMGWLGGVPVVRYYRAVGWRAMNWVLAGGVLYTGGAACDLFRWPVLFTEPVLVGPHEVFHGASRLVPGVSNERHEVSASVMSISGKLTCGFMRRNCRA